MTTRYPARLVLIAASLVAVLTCVCAGRTGEHVASPLTASGTAERHVLRVDLFRNESPAVVIRTLSRDDTVESWSNDTICWLADDAIDGGTTHASVSIGTRYAYGCDSGPRTVERAYWPVDLNGDGVDDLFVLEWHTGETSDPERGLIEYDKAAAVRLIVRAADKGIPVVMSRSYHAARGVASDETLTPRDVAIDPHCGEAVDHILTICTDPVWRSRLERLNTPR